MSDFVFGNIARGEDNGNIIRYTLMNQELYFDTAYRILRKKDNKNFVRCYKILYNGSIQFIYHVENYRSLFDLAGSYSVPQYMNLINTMIKELNEIRAMGFIQLETIDTDLHRIYVNRENMSVAFVCLPITVDTSTGTRGDFNSRITSTIADLIRNSGFMNDKVMSNVYQSCMNGALFGSQTARAKKSITLSCISHSCDVIHVYKDEFVIGKSPDADATVTVSSAISRRHCRLLIVGQELCVEDLNSLNGTYVNGCRLVVNRQYKLQNKDILRIANVEFMVNI